MRHTLRRTTFWLLWATVFSLPWQNSIVLPGAGTVTRVLGLFAALMGGLTWWLHGRARRLLDVQILIILLGVWSLLSLLWTIDGPNTRGYLTTIIQLVVLFVFLWEFTDVPGDAHRLLRAWVLGCFLGAFGIVASLADTEGARHSAFGFDENDLGSILAIGVPIAWYLASRPDRPLRRAAMLAYLPVGAIGVLLTGSRGAMLVLVAGLTLLPLSARHLPPHVRFGALFGLVSLGLLAVAVVPTATQARLATLGDEVQGGDFNQRLIVWVGALELIQEAPLQGTGAGTSELGLRDKTGLPLRAHNTFLSVGAELGLVGLGLLLLAVVATHLRTGGLPPPDRRAMRVILGALLMAMLPLHWELQKTPYVVIALLLLVSSEYQQTGPAVRTVPAPSGMEPS